MTSEIAAVVVEYRSPECTIECVSGLIDQGVCPVIVVDNSADEGATFRVLEYAFSTNPRVRLHDAGGNLGFSAGVNLGVSIARREGAVEYVLIINNDARAEPGLVDRLSAALRESQGAKFAYPTLIHAGTVMREVYYNRWLTVLSCRPLPGSFRVPRGCCLMLALERSAIPVFDERYFMYGEEVALGWKLRDDAFALCFVPEAVAVHAGSVGASLGSPFYEERTAAAHLLLSRALSTNGVDRVLLAIVRTLMVLLRSLLRAFRSRSLVPLCALPAAFRISRESQVDSSQS